MLALLGQRSRRPPLQLLRQAGLRLLPGALPGLRRGLLPGLLQHPKLRLVRRASRVPRLQPVILHPIEMEMERTAPLLRRPHRPNFAFSTGVAPRTGIRKRFVVVRLTTLRRRQSQEIHSLHSVFCDRCYLVLINMDRVYSEVLDFLINSLYIQYIL